MSFAPILLAKTRRLSKLRFQRMEKRTLVTGRTCEEFLTSFPLHPITSSTLLLGGKRRGSLYLPCRVPYGTELQLRLLTKHPLSCWEVNCGDCAMMLFGKESHPSSWWDGNEKPLALGDVERLSEAETRQLETVSVKVCPCLMPDDDARDELICAAMLPGFQFLWAREKYWIIINRLL